MKVTGHLSAVCLLAVNLPSALAGTVHCGPQWSVATGGGQFATRGSWRSAQWQGMWDTIQSHCQNLIHGPSSTEQDGRNVQIQTQIKSGQASWHCNTALSDIMHQCFDSSNLGGRTSFSGTWTSDSNNDEWYWLNVPTGDNAWCPTYPGSYCP